MAVVAPVLVRRRVLGWPVGPWSRLRAVLVAAWVLTAVVVAVVGQRSASLGDLQAAVADGRVGVVRVSGGLPRGVDAEGYASEDVTWHEGLWTRRTEVTEASAGASAPDSSVPVVRGDVTRQLRAEQPGLRVVREAPARSWSQLLGWRVPRWLGLAAVLQGLAAWWLLVNGPAPRRATRWAWFWLSMTPVTTLAFLLLSGPLPGLPAPRAGARWLTGGWAFGLSVVLGASVLSAFS